MSTGFYQSPTTYTASATAITPLGEVGPAKVAKATISLIMYAIGSRVPVRTTDPVHVLYNRLTQRHYRP